MAYRNLIIDDQEYSDAEMQSMQEAIDKKDLDLTLFKTSIKCFDCLCVIANTNYSYNQVLCAIGDAYIGENTDECSI